MIFFSNIGVAGPPQGDGQSSDESDQSCPSDWLSPHPVRSPCFDSIRGVKPEGNQEGGKGLPALALFINFKTLKDLSF